MGCTRGASCPTLEATVRPTVIVWVHGHVEAAPLQRFTSA